LNYKENAGFANWEWKLTWAPPQALMQLSLGANTTHYSLWKSVQTG